jgi:alpha-1,6-mannosyltransferase
MLTDRSFAIALIVLLASYLIVLRRADRMGWRWLWRGIGAAYLLTALAPPLLSSDVFGYIAYARLGAVHGLNPYLHPPAAAPGDPVLPLVYWQHQVSPYGPLFTLSSYVTAPLGVSGALWAFKAIATAAALASASLVARAVQAQGRDGRHAAALVGLNPLLILYAVGGAHNDLIVMLLVIAGLSLLSANAPRRGALALVAATATKVSAGIVLPFALVGARQPRATVVWTIGFLAGALGLTAAVFGTHILDTAASIVTQKEFVVDNSGPVLFGRLLGTGLTTPVRLAALAVAATVFVVQLWRSHRGADWIASCGWSTLALLVCSPAYAPWYICWLLPLAAIGRSRRLWIATASLTVVTALLYLPVFGRPPAP